jgi:hypothetical protein
MVRKKPQFVSEIKNEQNHKKIETKQLLIRKRYVPDATIKKINRFCKCL